MIDCSRERIGVRGRARVGNHGCRRGKLTRRQRLGPRPPLSILSMPRSHKQVRASLPELDLTSLTHTEAKKKFLEIAPCLFRHLQHRCTGKNEPRRGISCQTRLVAPIISSWNQCNVRFDTWNGIPHGHELFRVCVAYKHTSMAAQADKCPVKYITDTKQ